MTDDTQATGQPLENSDAPATKADLARLWQVIDARLTEMTAKMATQASLDNLAEHLGTFREQIEASVDAKVGDQLAPLEAKLDQYRAEVIATTREAITDLDLRVTTLEERVGRR